MGHIELRFSSPHHGWMRVELADAWRRVAHEVSDVPGDSLAMLVAVLRSLRGPVFAPLRLLAGGYTDLFRALPTILVIALLGYGAPALRIQGVPSSDIFWAITALVLVRQQFPGRMFLSGLIDLPFAVSPVIAGFMLILLFGPDTILGAFFGSLGVKVLFALPAMVLATLFVTFPFVVRELTPLLQTIGTEGEEAARTLGASEWQVFYKVTLPALRWGLVYGATLTTARAIGEFGAVLVVSGNILLLTQTATLHIYQNYVDFNYVGANAVAFTLLAVSFAILVVLEIAKARAHTAVEQV